MYDDEFRKHIRQDKAYQTMRSFIISEFTKGEIISLDTVLKRYYGKHSGSTIFDNWDVAILFDSVVSSLCQEGKMHLYASGQRSEYMLNRDNKAEIVIGLLRKKLAFEEIEKVCGISKEEILSICSKNDWPLYCNLMAENDWPIHYNFTRNKEQAEEEK